MMNNRNNVRQALSRPGTGPKDIVMPCVCNSDRLGLVAMQPERGAGVRGVVLFFVSAKAAAALLVKNSGLNEDFDGFSWSKRGVELNQRLRPQETSLHALFDTLADLVVL